MDEALERVKSQMRKGVLEYGILLILSHREAYSADLLQILKENDLIVVEGTLYPLLSRLRKDGMVSYSWVESTQGPPRKYYVITEKGRQFMTLVSESWKELVVSMRKLDSSDAKWHQLPSSLTGQVVEVAEAPSDEVIELNAEEVDNNTENDEL